MKRKISFLVCVALILSTLFTLSGCKETNSIIGTWEAKLDMADMINEGFSSDENLAPYLSVDEFELEIQVTYKEDGTYEMKTDDESAKEAIKIVKKEIMDGAREYLTDLISKSGLDIDVDDALASSGLDAENILDEKALLSEFETEGKYEAKDGKLYTWEEGEEKVEGEYETYEISDDELKLTAYYVDGKVDELAKEDYPIIFKKIS